MAWSALFSARKPLAAVLALQAAATGEASLAAPWARSEPPAWATPRNELTLAELLAHRSGYPTFPGGTLAFEALADVLRERRAGRRARLGHGGRPRLPPAQLWHAARNLAACGHGGGGESAS